jgi:hypothetical protein
MSVRQASAKIPHRRLNAPGVQTGSQRTYRATKAGISKGSRWRSLIERSTRLSRAHGADYGCPLSLPGSRRKAHCLVALAKLSGTEITSLLPERKGRRRRQFLGRQILGFNEDDLWEQIEALSPTFRPSLSSRERFPARSLCSSPGEQQHMRMLRHQTSWIWSLQQVQNGSYSRGASAEDISVPGQVLCSGKP